MSHFTVLVIGEDPEEQLAPFSENIEVPEYEIGTVSKEEKESFSSHYREEKKISPEVTFEEAYAIYGDDWNSNRWRQDKDGLWKEYSRYNPNSKWDWYSLGGRWLGFFRLKPGATGTAGRSGAFDNEPLRPGNVDQARKCDIDFEAMRDEAGKKAAEYYDRFWAFVGDQPLPNWKNIRERHGAETRADYIEQARRSRVVTFAVLKDGQWYEKGEMGWWGMVSNEKDQSEWNNQFYQLLESLPDNTLLSVYDCHI